MSEHWGFNQLMVTAAFRYCLGRRTYIVGVCVDWIIEHWEAFSESTKELIKRELEEEFETDDRQRASGSVSGSLGWDCDRRDWERVRALYAQV